MVTSGSLRAVVSGLSGNPGHIGGEHLRLGKHGRSQGAWRNSKWTSGLQDPFLPKCEVSSLKLFLVLFRTARSAFHVRLSAAIHNLVRRASAKVWSER